MCVCLYKPKIEEIFIFTKKMKVIAKEGKVCRKIVVSKQEKMFFKHRDEEKPFTEAFVQKSSR